MTTDHGSGTPGHVPTLVVHCAANRVTFDSAQLISVWLS